MQLRGWTNPLPEWIVEQIKAGNLVIIEGKDSQWLHGKVVNPQGTKVEFN